MKIIVDTKTKLICSKCKKEVKRVIYIKNKYVSSCCKSIIK